MSGLHQNLRIDGVPIVRLESAHLQVAVAPGIGGRVISLIEKTPMSVNEAAARQQCSRLAAKSSRPALASTQGMPAPTSVDSTHDSAT